MKSAITIAVAAACIGLTSAASAQPTHSRSDTHIRTGRSVAAPVQFDGYSANFGPGGRVYPTSQTQTGGPSGSPGANGG